MLQYTARRLLIAIPVLWAAFTLSFLLIRAAPGDPVDIMYGPQQDAASPEAVTKEQKDARRRELGIDQPLPVQYVNWFGRVLHGDIGTSFKSRRAVWVELQQRLPATFALAAASFVIKVVVVVGLGILAAVKVGSLWDHFVRVFALFLVAMPSFWLGLLLLWFFAVHVQWITVAGPATLQRVVLPAVTLGLVTAPTVMRVLRASLLAELGRAHVVFGRAKGLPERLILWRHTLRLALLPSVTLLGISLTYLLTGSVIIESVFSWPGVGKYVMDSIQARDYPVIQGFVLLATTITILGNLLVDLAYGMLDPRIRLGAVGPA
jgi:peptide/nickel transport system permease protein